MQIMSLQLPLSVILGLSTLCAHAITVNFGDQLTINSGVYGEYGVISGSYFAADIDANSLISDTEKTALHQGTEGFIIGVIQGTGTSTHMKQTRIESQHLTHGLATPARNKPLHRLQAAEKVA